MGRNRRWTGWQLHGWNFNNKRTNPNATIYFPALGYRYGDNLSLSGLNNSGSYWAASVGPYNGFRGYNLSISENWIYNTSNENNPASGYCVRPVADN